MNNRVIRLFQARKRVPGLLAEKWKLYAAHDVKMFQARKRVPGLLASTMRRLFHFRCTVSSAQARPRPFSPQKEQHERHFML